jgi:hypothetical protein
MDLTATLTPAELEALSNYDHHSLQDAARGFDRMTAAVGYSSEGAFEKSLRIKNTLDMFEEQSRARPSEKILAVLLNCEYLLWRLNVDTLLKHNPFLSHWVEAIQRLERPAGQVKGTRATSDGISMKQINSSRVFWIQTILQGENLELFAEKTPQEVSNSVAHDGLGKPFVLKPYIRMLEDEGIYERTPEPEVTATSSSMQPHTSDHNNELSAQPRKTYYSVEDSIQKQKDDILHNLKEHPDAATFDITRLPISLTYLDFLTTILSDRTLEKHSIDPAPVITQYIQHALRTVERMDKPPSPSSDANSDWSERARPEDEVLEYGKEAQSRHILLLLLFIKSLLRKGLVQMDTLFYEIAEITVRYVWIKEVREFRTWAEEGIKQDGG